jgi:glycerol-1-phosphatase
MTWLLDLDGVVWLGERPIDGAADAVARLRRAGERVIFATNNSWARVADQESKLDGMGIPAAGDVVTSAMAAATLVEPGERVLVSGGPGSASSSPPTTPGLASPTRSRSSTAWGSRLPATW